MKETQGQDIGELIQTETAKRLDEMRSPDYEFPPRVGKGDWAALGAIVAGSLTLIVLCMTGVIV